MNAAGTSAEKNLSIPMEDAAPSQGALERRFWRHWFLLIGVSVVVTIGLTVAIGSLISWELSVWPWMRSDFVLLVCLAVLVLAVATHLTHEQRKISVLRGRHANLQRQTLERIQGQTRRLGALLNVSQIMVAEIEPQTVFDAITHHCIEVFDCHQASLLLYDTESGMLEVRSATGYDNLVQFLSTRYEIGEGTAGWVAAHREPLLIERPVDQAAYPGLKLTDPSISAAMVVPIAVQNELIGVLQVNSRTASVRFDQQDLRALLVFAENARVCIRHSQEITRLRRENARLQRASGAPHEVAHGKGRHS